MATTHSLLSAVNSATGVACKNGIRITAILEASTVSIDGVRFAASPMEFESPIWCTSFVASVGAVAYDTMGPTTTFALLYKYGNYAVTQTSYNFGSAGGGTDPEAVEAGLIADYATSGIKIARMASVEDLLADSNILTSFTSMGFTGGNLKVEDPSKLGSCPSCTNEYFYLNGSRQRNFYLGDNSGLLHTYNVPPVEHPFAGAFSLWIKSWNGARITLVKLS